MTDRVEEIRRRRERLSHVLDDGGDEQALVGSDIDWLLAALAQAERERDNWKADFQEACRQRDKAEVQAGLFKHERDSARADLARVHDHVAHVEKGYVEEIARTRAALKRLADTAGYHPDYVRAALEGRG